MSITKSKQIFELLEQLIPGGVNSPARAFGQVDVHPIVAKQAQGDLLIDADGNEFIDFVMGWGALILGHNHPKVVQALKEQMAKGICFVNSSELELRLAQLICEIMPSMERVRFVLSGTEATMSAIRLARAYTGKEVLIKFDGNYHGHSDSLLVKAGSGAATINASKGILKQQTLSLPYNDVEALERAFQNEIAAVIVEPVVGNMGVVPASKPFMEALQALTKKHNTLLIFDEVMSGFRVGLGGAQELYGVTPDLTCLGKVIGGGLPVGAFGGRKEIMEMLAPMGEVYQAGTLAGNPLAMSAGIATLEELKAPGFYEELERKKKLLLGGISTCVQHVGAMFTLFWGVDEVRNFEDTKKMDQALFREFFRHCYEKGIYLPQSPYEAGFISMAHTDEHLKYVNSVILSFFR